MAKAGIEPRSAALEASNHLITEAVTPAKIVRGRNTQTILHAATLR